MIHCGWAFLRSLPVVLVGLCLSCSSSPSIELTRIPEAGPGGKERFVEISGKVSGGSKADRVVLFAWSDVWWVQPTFTKPFTPIGSDGTWSARIHMGTEYAALLVNNEYSAPRTVAELPKPGNGVLAVVRAPGLPSPKNGKAKPEPKVVRFSGYDWDVIQESTDSGGVMHVNSGANVFTDAQGRLHLRITKVQGNWHCAEVSLRRSLGHGKYSFVFGEAPVLEPGTVLGMFTWDPTAVDQNHREVNIELSQWGDPQSKNAQFVIQPYYLPANVYRFNTPAVPSVHTFHWGAEQVAFESVERTTGARPRTIARHVFTSGIPSPGGERVHLNLYIFGKTRTPQQKEAEVVIEKFEYLP